MSNNPRPRRQPDKPITFVLCAFGGLMSATGAYAHADEHSVADGALVSPSEIVDCTLENGEAAQCASYVVKYLPDDLEIGPFCPATLDEEGGIPGSRFPQDFTLPDPDGGFDFDTNGLFQEDRFVADDGLPGTLARLILAFQDGNMFLAQGYTSVTQEILSLALEEYNRLIADGATPAYAAQQLAQTLEQAGVDADVAQELVDAIANGDFTADDSVVNVLKQMANAGDGQQISKL